MTDEQRDEIIKLAYEYLRSTKDRDKSKETIAQRRVLLFMALEKAEASGEPRRNPEEGARTGAGGNGNESHALTG